MADQSDAAADGSGAKDGAAAGEPAEPSAGSSRRGRATAITTFLRVRPDKRGGGYFRLPGEGAAGLGGTGKELPVVEVEVPKDELAGMVDNKRTNWRFRFDGVLGEASLQQEVFERVAEPVVASVLEGFNGTIFAYGQTGSGKTYTLTGGVDAYEERGIIPRALSHIYNKIAATAGEVEHTVRISYLEIYNQHGYDLLDSTTAGPRGTGDGGGFTLPRIAGVADDEDGRGVVVRGLSSHVATSEEAALGLLLIGDTNRAVAETSMNAHSSRSHCIFTVYIESRAAGGPTVRRSKLQMVDLAGSERVGKTGATGSTLGEAKHINVSLHFLELVIMQLHEAKRKGGKTDAHVPYRNSLLTSVLRDSLGGNCRTVMVAAVHPSRAHTDESISTCRFAQRVAKIQNEVSKNEEVDPAVLIARLQEENRKLRDANPADDDGGTELTGADLRALRRAVRLFLADPAPEAAVEWGRGRRAAKVRHALWMLKTMLSDGVGLGGHGRQEGEEGGEEEGEGAPAPGDAGGGEGGGEAAGEGREASLRRRIAQLSRQVADKEDECKALQARLRLLARGEPAAAAEPPGAMGGRNGDGGRGGDADAGGLSRSELSALSDRDAAAQLFATSFARGTELARARAHAQAALRPQLDAARALGAALVAARDDIATVRAAVEARRVQAAIEGLSAGGSAENTGGEGEEEELRLVGALQQKKEVYKNKTAELKHLKMHVGAMQARCQASQGTFEAEFGAWWRAIREAHGLPPPPTADGAAPAPAARPAPPDPVAASGARRPAAEAWAEQPARAPAPESHHVPPAAGEGGDSLAGNPTASVLRDPASALNHFRLHVWTGEARARREALKTELADAVAQAKESGQLVARRRAQISTLKEMLAQSAAAALADASDPDTAGGGDAAGRRAAEIRARLEMDKEAYREEVSALRELKHRIEAVQVELDRSQRALQDDFGRWHGTALAKAERAERERDGAPPPARRTAWS